MTLQQTPHARVEEASAERGWFGHSSALLLGLLVLAVFQHHRTRLLDSPGLSTSGTMFVAVVVQSLPFLVMGVLLAAAISTLLSDPVLPRAVPTNPLLAVPVAGLAVSAWSAASALRFRSPAASFGAVSRPERPSRSCLRHRQ